MYRTKDAVRRPTAAGKRTSFAVRLSLLACAAVLAAGSAAGFIGERGARAAGLTLADVMRDAPWALPSIAEMVQKQVFEGYPDGTFGPNREVSRIEALAAVVRQMGLREEAEKDSARRVRLQAADADVIREQHAWAIGYVRQAESKRLLDDPRGELRPGDAADREWITRVIVRALGQAKQAEAAMGNALTFRDASSIDDGSVGYVHVADRLGIIKGYPDGTFRPKRTVTRAELAALLDRVGDLMPEAMAEYPEIEASVVGFKDQFVTLRQGSATEPIHVVKTATIVRGGKLVSLHELQPGDQVRAVFNRNYEIIHMTVTREAAVPEGKRSGMIRSLLSIGQGVFSLQTDSGVLELKLAPNAVITRNGKPASFSDLREGDDAVVMLKSGAVTELHATEVNRFTGQIRGVLEAINGKELTVAQNDGTKITLPLYEHATFLLNQKLATWRELKAGYSVTAVASEGFVHYVTAHVDSIAQNLVEVSGIVAEVYPDVKPPHIWLAGGAGGQEQAYVLKENAAVTKFGKDIQLKDIKPGDRVLMVMESQEVLLIIVEKEAPPLEGHLLEDLTFYDYAGRRTITEITVTRMVEGYPVRYSFPVHEDVVLIGGEIWELMHNTTKVDLILNEEGTVKAIVFKEKPSF